MVTGVDTVADDPVTAQPIAPLPMIDEPSGLPTNSPTDTLVFEPPSNDDCAAVAKGEDLPGQENLTFRTFQMIMNVVLSTDDSLQESAKQEVQSKMQSVKMPLLVGCSTKDTPCMRGRKLNDVRHLLSSVYVIENAQVNVSAEWNCRIRFPQSI